MKKILIISTILFFTLAGNKASAQCDTDTYSSACIPKLSNGFNYLKSYKVDGQTGQKTKVEYSYVFTKGTQYMLNICTPGEGNDGVVVQLFDSRRNMVGSSLYNGEKLSAFVYPCNSTGLYYITYTFDGSESFCAGSALGFKK